MSEGPRRMEFERAISIIKRLAKNKPPSPGDSRFLAEFEERHGSLDYVRKFFPQEAVAVASDDDGFRRSPIGLSPKEQWEARRQRRLALQAEVATRRAEREAASLEKEIARQEAIEQRRLAREAELKAVDEERELSLSTTMQQRLRKIREAWPAGEERKRMVGKLTDEEKADLIIPEVSLPVFRSSLQDSEEHWFCDSEYWGVNYEYNP